MDAPVEPQVLGLCPPGSIKHFFGSGQGMPFLGNGILTVADDGGSRTPFQLQIRDRQQLGGLFPFVKSDHQAFAVKYQTSGPTGGDSRKGYLGIRMGSFYPQAQLLRGMDPSFG